MDLFDARSLEEFAILNRTSDECAMKEQGRLGIWPEYIYTNQETNEEEMTTAKRIALLPLDALLFIVLFPVLVLEFLIAMITFTAFTILIACKSDKTIEEDSASGEDVISNGECYASSRAEKTKATGALPKQSTFEATRNGALMALYLCQSDAVRKGIAQCSIPRNGS